MGLNYPTVPRWTETAVIFEEKRRSKKGKGPSGWDRKEQNLQFEEELRSLRDELEKQTQLLKAQEDEDMSQKEKGEGLIEKGNGAATLEGQECIEARRS